MFSLGDNSRLNDLRDALEEAEFRYAGSEGRALDYAVILDDVYLNTTGSMERQIEYVRVLYNGLFALAMIIGFAAAWLLTSSRGREISLMRALGAPGAVISANFILEQILLLAIGLAVGLGLHRLISGGFTKTQLVLTAIFSACWLAGCITGLAPKLLGRTLDGLADPE